MGIHCCKDKNQDEEITETDNQNTYGDTYNQNNHEDVFKTKPPCMYGHQCSCPCHQGGVCIFKLKSKLLFCYFCKNLNILFY